MWIVLVINLEIRKLCQTSTKYSREEKMRILCIFLAVANILVFGNLLYDYYQVKPGEKPEDVAYDFYGSAELHWLVLYANNIVDRYHQWPMSVRAFEEYLSEKYANPLATHHFEISQKSGDTTVKINIGLDSTGHSGDTVSAVTNREYEEDLQTQYSKIRLVRKEFVNQIRKELRTLLQSDN